MKTGRGKYPERISIRVSTDLKESLDRLSLDDNRSLANYIRIMLAQYVQQMIKSKEEAIAFAKKYLETRKEQLSCAEEGYEIFDMMLEHVILDIIPYLYGEALD